jgi:hypothetical protein
VRIWCQFWKYCYGEECCDADGSDREFEELNMRRRDGTKVGYTRMVPNVRRDLGYPWVPISRS